MRAYSLRSAYPLARSSQSRRRLMLLYNLNTVEADAEVEEDNLPAEDPTPETPAQADPSISDPLPREEDNDRTLDADELRRMYAEQSPAAQKSDNQFAEQSQFLEEIFQDSEARNEKLASGEVSESVLDEDEADVVDSPGSLIDESLLSSSLGDESIILSGSDEESRIFSMEDLREPVAEELPGSEPPRDRKPHFPSWYVPNLKTVKRLLDGDKPVTWMFAGESAASAADLAQGRRNFTDHFGERIRTELGRMLDVVINSGNTEETCSNLVNNLEWRVLRFHPEVVSLLLGRNDATRGATGREEFRDSLEQIVQIVREAGAILVLHTPNAIDATRADHLSDLPSYVDIIRDVAKSYNVPLIDHWKHWNEQKPDTESLRTWLSADGAQPGVYGQREMAKLIFHRFEIFDPHSPICNARVP